MSKREKIYALKSHALLKQARAIFGRNQIKDAWKLSTYSLNDKDYWLKHAKEPYVSSYSVVSSKSVKSQDVIDLANSDIVLLFSNGKYVEFGASEWGNVRNFTDEMVEIE